MTGMARHAFFVLSGVFLVVGLLAGMTLPGRDAGAFLGGYLLFAADIAAIAWVSKALVAAQAVDPRPQAKGGALAIAGLKFLLLGAGLYWMLVVVELSGFYVAAGAFLALVLICILAYVHVVKGRATKGFP